MDDTQEFLDAIDRRLTAIERKVDFCYRREIERMGKSTIPLTYCSVCRGFIDPFSSDEIVAQAHIKCMENMNEAQK